jgi:hypothetical protein
MSMFTPTWDLLAKGLIMIDAAQQRGGKDA